MLHRLILFVRHLRGVVVFKNSIRFLVLFLMLAGAWVATRELDIPLGFEPNDKIIHSVVFFGFAVLVDLSSSRKPFWLWKGLPLLLYGIGIEIMQYFTPERSFSMLDWGADLAGILLYFIAKRLSIWLDLKRLSSS
jgi:hypothetical protein